MSVLTVSNRSVNQKERLGIGKIRMMKYSSKNKTIIDTNDVDESIYKQFLILQEKELTGEIYNQ